MDEYKELPIFLQQHLNTTQMTLCNILSGIVKEIGQLPFYYKNKYNACNLEVLADSLLFEIRNAEHWRSENQDKSDEDWKKIQSNFVKSLNASEYETAEGVVIKKDN